MNETLMKETIWKEIENAASIAIAGHIRPDGDCVGSCMAMYLYLKKEYPNKEIEVYFEKMPERFAYLFEGEDYREGFDTLKDCQLFIALDASDEERLGGAIELKKSAASSICIDHHISNMGYAQYNVIDADASSASEVLYELLEEEKIDKKVATALYLGIVHDSGVFKYPNTSRRTMEIGGILVEKGIEKTSLVDQTFFRKSYVQNQILGRVLLESILVLNGKVIASRVTKKMMDFYGATTEDLDGIVEQMRITDGVEMAIFLHEVEPLLYKVSMRANEKMDVSAIAQHFGGGGHVKAAGCTMHGTYYDILNSLLTFADAQLQ